VILADQTQPSDGAAFLRLVQLASAKIIERINSAGSHRMEALKVGMKHVSEREVTEAMTTKRGDYRVFSTPSMVQFCEASAGELIAPHLQPGQGQVGIVVTIRHMGPTPMGKRVRAEVELTGIDRRRLSFKIKVFDDIEQVGEAEHDRFIVDLDKYQAKLKKKIEG
jgi:predicted thioesterase